MRYYKTNNIHIIEVPIKDFKIIMCDKRKKTAADKNYCNAGFFGTFHEDGVAFTLPAGHLVCDFDAQNKWVKHYCEERGKFNGKKFTFDCSTWKYMNEFYGNKVSTLIVSAGSASIVDCSALPSGLDYAISGVPVIRNGEAVKFKPYVTNQGWGTGSLYATWHTLVGLKKDGKTIYVMCMKTTKGNMISSGEAYKMLKPLGLHDVINLDGGGSFYLNVDGEVVASTSENRLINSIILFGDLEQNENNENKNENKKANPYIVPTMVLKQWNKYKEQTKWLQWQLTAVGYACDVDGCFGPDTLKKVKAFQKAKKLVVDGMVGPATRKALLES